MLSRINKPAIIASAALAISALLTNQAHGQIWIGQIVGDIIAQQQAAAHEHACRTGAPMPDSEITETRATAEASITGYWQAVQSGQPAKVAKYFSAGKKSQWVSGENIVGLTGFSKVQDPFAQQGAALNRTPLAYLRSGDGGTVHGLWQVRGAGGALIGTYDAAFKRSGGTWLLSDLQLLGASQPVYPLVQYCHKRDDVLPYRLSWSESNVAFAERRATKLAAKADKAKIEADKLATAAENAKAGAKTAKLALAKEAADTAKKARDKATEAGVIAKNAALDHESAKNDAAASEAAKASARAAAGVS